jgi:hypothetical protein
MKLGKVELNWLYDRNAKIVAYGRRMLDHLAKRKFPENDPELFDLYQTLYDAARDLSDELHDRRLKEASIFGVEVKGPRRIARVKRES